MAFDGTGRKWWYVCGTLSNETSSKCFEGVVQPGEVLYYGRGWSHETQNVDAPTITLTDTAVHQRNYQAVADKLYGECTREVLDFKFSGACAMLLTNVTVLCMSCLAAMSLIVYIDRGARSLPKRAP